MVERNPFTHLITLLGVLLWVSFAYPAEAKKRPIDGDDLQVVLGLAAPIGLTRPTNDYSVFLYLSVEHNFVW